MSRIRKTALRACQSFKTYAAARKYMRGLKNWKLERVRRTATLFGWRAFYVPPVRKRKVAA